MKYRISIVDDEPSICTSLTLALNIEYEVSSFTDAAKALTYIASEGCDLVLLDLKIGPYDGIEILKKIKEMDSSISVIMMTAYGSIRNSVTAMKNGAFTYLAKPLDIEELMIFIKQALEFKELNKRVTYLSDELQKRYKYGDMIGQSASMQRVYEMIEKFKDADVCVTISGESGTGKELAARAMHFLSKRKNELFVAVNCAAIPDGLMEEEFFGHKKGSFTGATTDKSGKLEIAHKGTLFLDEIGDMPLVLQGKLLRVLQQKELTPIGGTQVKKIDVRVITATNRNLEQMVAQGTFRQDLYYRLNVLRLTIPPLRERKKDIPLLCNFFIQKYAKDQAKRIDGISKQAQELLLNYNFPGNIREMANGLEYATIVCSNGVIDVEDLPDYITKGDKIVSTDNLPKNVFSGMSLKEIEKIVITQALQRNGGHQKNTANELGISERGLRNKIKEYSLNE